jgi:hypothetical protein
MPIEYSIELIFQPSSARTICQLSLPRLVTLPSIRKSKSNQTEATAPLVSMRTL